MPEENIAEVASVEAPKTEDISTVTPTTEVIDPRIVAVIGEDKIESAFGKQSEKEEKPTEEAAPVEGEAKPEVKTEEAAPAVQVTTAPDVRPSRLDRRLADRYIHNLHLSGETNIPTEAEIIADLKNYSKEEKIQALHFHLSKEKELRGDTSEGNELDDEDRAAIADAEKEAMRNEILSEEHETRVKTDFVSFMDNHPELVPGTKEHNPVLEKAVEKLTFPRGIDGPMAMPISEAYEIVTSQLQAVRDAQIVEEKKEKNASLSGVLSGSGQIVPETKELGWEDVARIEKEDPDLYRRMLQEGKFKHLK